MVRRRQSVDNEDIVAAADEAALLLKACPDLHDWPMRWRYDASDIAPGTAIVATFRPFLVDLLRSKISKRTFNRHRDNLWLIGGEIIRRRLEDPKLKRLPIDTSIRHLVDDDDGAPLVWPHITEAEQDALDATCRQFHRFLNQSTAAL